jgi:Sigma-70 region 2
VPGADDAVDGPAEAEYRPLLFSIAYGMTGSAGDAEDIVQDAFLGLTRARQAGTTITDPKAYLATAVMRLGINYQESARVRRETYVGDWLPEPIVVPVNRDGTGRACRAGRLAVHGVPRAGPSRGAATLRDRWRPPARLTQGRPGQSTPVTVPAG